MSIRTLKAIAASGGVAAEPDLIEQSLVFNSGDGAYLHRTPGSAGNRRTFTWSGWVKRGAFSTTAQHALFSAGSSNSDFTMLYINKVYSGQPDGGLFFYTWDGTTDYGFVTNARLRDTAAWYHVVYSVDTTLATAADRIKIYINNQLISDSVFADYGTIPQNHYTHINNTNAHYIGRYQTNAQYFDGYLAEVHFIDGTAYAPSVFAETNSETNQWVPKEVTGATYGTNGFHFKFASGALGTDSSGNSANYTTVNLADTDVMLDTPNNNFPTLNYLMSTLSADIELDQGNLRAVSDAYGNSNGGDNTAVGTMGFDTAGSTGYYFEVYCEAMGRTDLIWTGWQGVGSISQTESDGIDSSYAFVNGSTGSTDIVAAYRPTGDWTNVGDEHGTRLSGAIYGLAIKNNKMWFRMNGTWYGDPAANTPSSPAVGTPLVINIPDGHKVPMVTCFGGYLSYGNSIAVVNFGQNGTFSGNKTAAGNTDANGIGNFFYSVPSGFLALCSKNLADPTITLPGEHFNTVLYSGDGGTDQAITGVGFEPSLVWNKIRNTTNWHQMYDQVRGVNDAVFPNDTYVEYTYSGGGVKAFGSDGFTVGNNTNSTLNDSGSTYVTWNWKANGSGSANTDGDIDSTVSVNNTAGFSIVTWIPNGSATDRIGHGLGVAPNIVMYKALGSAVDWYVWTDASGTETVNQLNATTASTAWNSAGYGSNSNATGFSNYGWGLSPYVEMLAYCFTEVEGYSKIASYVGNNVADGPFVYTGFRPAFIMMKSISTGGSATYSWSIFDTKRSSYNIQRALLEANTGAVEDTSQTADLDILSNGFKPRYSPNETNGPNTYIYMAFAEAPFKYANAR